MIAFNQKIIENINKEVQNGETVIIKASHIPPGTQENKNSASEKKVDTVTSGSFETKMHFAQSQIAVQNASPKKNK